MQQKPRPVVITLASKADRDEWLSKRRNRITNADVFNNQNKNAIYINEDLIKPMRHLLWITKMELKPAFKYIWINNGRILVKKDEDIKKTHIIRSEGDIKALKSSGLSAS